MFFILYFPFSILNSQFAFSPCYNPISPAAPMPQEKTRKPELKAVPSSFSSPVDASEPIDLCPKCGGAGLEIIEGKGARICSCRKLRTQSGQFASVGLPK